MSETDTTRPDRQIPDEANYEELVRLLEESVSRLESGELNLEDAVLEYEFGMKLIERCNSMLDNAELRVTELSANTQTTAENDV